MNEQELKDALIVRRIIESDDYQKLMSGGVINLCRYDLDLYITHQIVLNINTLQIQRGSFGYALRVDRPTVERYLANMSDEEGGFNYGKA